MSSRNPPKPATPARVCPWCIRAVLKQSFDPWLTGPVQEIYIQTALIYTGVESSFQEKQRR